MARPTILIGHGGFGKEVLQRLLSNTAPRGTLQWELAPRGDEGVGQHRLRDLALLWMPSARVSADETGERDAGRTKTDFIMDLYRQIRTVENLPGAADQALGDAVADAAKGLTLPETILRRGEEHGGLDVIVIAHVDRPDVIGTLDTLTKALLNRLVREHPTLRVNLQAARKLNCIEILDFDNFHRPDAQGRAVRRSLKRSMKAWKDLLDGKRPSLDRCYLIDGRARDSYRDLKSRYDEVTLFLEFLLFSGQRDDERLRELYQQTGQDQQIAAGFGVRLMERSPELLSRIAAARFGEGWLPYLRGRDTGFTRPARRVAESLAPFLAQAYERVEDGTSLEDRWREAVAGIAKDLLALPDPEADDWPLRAQQVFAQGTRMLELDLNRAGLDLIRRVRETHLQDGGRAIEDAVTGDLHDSMAPVPLAAVQQEIDESMRGLEQNRGGTGRRDWKGGHLLEAAAAAHRDFVAARDEWISGFGRGLSGFWPLLAGILGFGVTPYVRDLLRQLPLLAEPETPLFRQLMDTVELIDRPVFVAPVLFLLLWLLLRLLVQPRITNSILRARDFFTERRHGRLRDAIWSDCTALRGLLEQVQTNVRSTLTADLLQVLGGIRERLHEREREIEWLRGQLGEFLRLHGLHPGQDRLEPPENSVHMLVLDDQDLARMMEAQPAEAQQFQDHQASLPEPFKGWTKRYCDTFLDLFQFVDRLSGPYLSKLADDPGSDRSGREWQLRRDATQDFLAQPGFGLTFQIDADKSESAAQTYCVMPSDWIGEQGVRDLLGRIAVSGERIRRGEDPSRVYLLKCQLNIGLEALEAAQ